METPFLVAMARTWGTKIVPSALALAEALPFGEGGEVRGPGCNPELRDVGKNYYRPNTWGQRA